MANTTRIKDLSSVTTPSDSDVIAVDGANGTKGITLANLATTILNKLSSKLMDSIKVQNVTNGC